MFTLNSSQGDSDDESNFSVRDLLTSEDERALLTAAEKGDLDGVKELLAKDPNLASKTKDVDGYTPLHRAAYEGHLEVARTLLEAGAPLQAKTGSGGWQPIHSAAMWGHVAMVDLFLSGGIDPNVQTSESRCTPLHLAAGSRSPNTHKLIAYLLTRPGIDPEAVNRQGDTPFDIAYRTGPHYKLWRFVEGFDYHKAVKNLEAKTMPLAPINGHAEENDLNT